MASLYGDERFHFDKKLLEPYNYYCNEPGKPIRTKIIAAFNHWLKVPQEKIKSITEIVTILHNSSLLVDDIEDDSKLRRDSPTAHKVYGVAWALNASNYAYFIGLEKTISLGHTKAPRIYAEQLLALHQGQGMDIWFRDNFTCPTEDEYKALVIKKTSGLFGLAIRLMQLFSKEKYHFQTLIEQLGLLFQILDDFQNSFPKNIIDKKSFCEDITEGKFSFPIIHAIKTRPDDKEIFSILRQRTTDIELKKHVVKLLEEFGSYKYTVNTLVQLEQSVLKEIKRLGGNPYLENLVHELLKIVY